MPGKFPFWSPRVSGLDEVYVLRPSEACDQAEFDRIRFYCCVPVMASGKIHVPRVS